MKYISSPNCIGHEWYFACPNDAEDKKMILKLWRTLKYKLMKGSVMMDYDGKSFEMKPGDTLPVEKWKYHSFIGMGPALLLEISKPCIVEDNYFENKSIPIGGNFNCKK